MKYVQICLLSTYFIVSIILLKTITSPEIFIKYILILGIFMIIILPSSFYQIEVNGTDSVFSRIINSGTSLGESVFDKEVENSKFNLISSFEILIKILYQ